MISFCEWYLLFQEEVAKLRGKSYANDKLCWHDSDVYSRYYELGKTPKQAAEEYLKTEQQ